MVKYFKNLILYVRFRRALRRCEELNSTRPNNKYIVANIVGKPYLINRTTFRIFKQKGVFRYDLKWSDITAKQVTKERLQQWIS